MARAVLLLALITASCGSISPIAPDGGSKGDTGTTGTGGTGTGQGGAGGGGGSGAGGLVYTGGISTLGPAVAPAGALRVIRQGLAVPASPTCNASLCFYGGITQ